MRLLQQSPVGASARALAQTVALLCLIPGSLTAQPQVPAGRWVIAGGLGVGVANVPNTPTPVYFDASQLTARASVQRGLGAGVLGGVSLSATLGAEGSDCVLGPCAPPVTQHALSGTLSYVPGGTVRSWLPIASANVGVARLPEQWGVAPNRRTPSATTWVIGGAVDLPIVVRPHSALLLGWETTALPDAPGGRVVTNTVVLALRRDLRR